jgi:short-subunit dehydrogenase
MLWIPVNVLMQVTRDDGYLENLYMSLDKKFAVNINYVNCDLQKHVLVFREKQTATRQ